MVPKNYILNNIMLRIGMGPPYLDLVAWGGKEKKNPPITLQ